jgi:hypothetical protein
MLRSFQTLTQTRSRANALDALAALRQRAEGGDTEAAEVLAKIRQRASGHGSSDHTER